MEEYKSRGEYQITEKMDKFKFSGHGNGVTVITEQTSEY
jgi:hypothetical protein